MVSGLSSLFRSVSYFIMIKQGPYKPHYLGLGTSTGYWQGVALYLVHSCSSSPLPLPLVFVQVFFVWCPCRPRRVLTSLGLDYKYG